ncbi:MAG: hypothetical protein COU69_03290 [Candidatus Pacebacteria bacterium CG10_big_fil_rev_8_21_14_0_10_56_10]|nr:MAG: hypothetical protein COU69_03290 [Candidatus Pacebacteria bacterium CG10_big_fil_rev_8_21_14_0_10_56_10]
MMKALILAAGESFRLRPRYGTHKCLINVHGRRMIDWILTACQKAGISEAVVVTGKNHSELSAAVGDGDDYNLRISYLVGGGYQTGNGTSAYSARHLLPAEFMLLMSDHIFDPQTLIEMQMIPLESRQCVLAVDYKLGSITNEADATKVAVEKQKRLVLSIGKGLSNFNGYDTGMFKCSPSIFTVPWPLRSKSAAMN